MKIITKNYLLKKMSLKMANKNYLDWFNDTEVKSYIKDSPKSVENLKFYIKKTIKNPKTLFWAIFKKNRHLGNIKIDQINKKNKSGVLGILFGNKKFRNIGLAHEVIEAVKKYLIKKNIQYLYLGVKKNNIAAINTYLKSGFYKYKVKNDIIFMKCNIFTSRLILGGAQLNFYHGITNFNKYQQTKLEMKNLINFITKNNIYHIDGAEAYSLFKNENLDILDGLKVDTKISLKDITSYKNLKYKIERLIKKKIIIETLFVHDGDNILKKNNSKKLSIFYKLKKNKNIKNIGISSYDFKVLKKIVTKFKIDVVQIPYNLVDRRLEKYQNFLIKSGTKKYQINFSSGFSFKESKSYKKIN